MSAFLRTIGWPDNKLRLAILAGATAMGLMFCCGAGSVLTYLVVRTPGKPSDYTQAELERKVVGQSTSRAKSLLGDPEHIDIAGGASQIMSAEEYGRRLQEAALNPGVFRWHYKGKAKGSWIILYVENDRVKRVQFVD